jgi:hypothetical protein
VSYFDAAEKLYRAMRQSFPGYQNTARDAGGQAMKNWWPFLYY